ncbi:hypothetical protein [Winogradskyella pulchriflava]|uniref:Uncharacterized protein n=1 Tax=Winogradskyella pulchriflava TaxID=1110688 RepID=A0ABV6QC71_9FLAO
MLLIPDLITFSDAHQAERANLEANIVVGDDSEVSDRIKDLANANNQCTLITVIPSHNSNIQDEDTRQMANNLMFFIVKKYDSKGGLVQKTNNYTICQAEALALLNKILDLKDAQQDNCLFADLQPATAPITPVSNYFNQNGYLLQLTTRTDF